MIEYTTPVSVDTFGSYPGKKVGDVFEVMHEGRVFTATIVGQANPMPYGAVLRDTHFQQVEGPVKRDFIPFENRHPNWRKYTGRRH